MGEKDIAEKDLAWHDDVFADIVNAWFAVSGIRGWTVRPEDLEDARTETSYASSEGLHGQGRDVLKLWSPAHAKMAVCLVGLEDQTAIDTYMSLRVFGYEGADYRYQLTPKMEDGRLRRRKPHPVFTIVLYFGTRRRWPKRRSLLDRLGVPEELRGIMNDIRPNVFELAWLSEEEEALFKSDFRHVVRYLRQARMGQELRMLPDPIAHGPELLRLLKALTRDDRFDEMIETAQFMERRGQTMKLPSILEQAEERGIARGRDEGIALGEKRGRDEGIALGRDEGIALGTERGRMGMLFSLVDDGLIPIGAAANKVGMDEAEFRARMDERG